MNTALIVSIAGLVINAVLALILWSINAKIREVARTEVEKFDSVITERVSQARSALKAESEARWEAHQDWREEALKGINANHEASVRRIELLEEGFRATTQIGERLAGIEATLKVLMRGLHISVRENGNNLDA